MTTRANGTFEVRIKPQPADDYTDATALGRMTIDKEFKGDLAGTSKGQMLTGMASVKGSGAYVAIERVTGTLHGKRGSFILHHVGVMARGVYSLAVTVAPDTGTDQLTGIAGTMNIIITDGKHSFEFDYTLPTAPDDGDDSALQEPQVSP